MERWRVAEAKRVLEDGNAVGVLGLGYGDQDVAVEEQKAEIGLGEFQGIGARRYSVRPVSRR